MVDSELKRKINWDRWKDGVPLPENPVTRAYLARSCFGTEEKDG